jgi:hypothetical protein
MPPRSKKIVTACPRQILLKMNIQIGGSMKLCIIPNFLKSLLDGRLTIEGGQFKEAITFHDHLT